MSRGAYVITAIMRATLACLFVAGAVVLSGCGAFGGSAPETRTVTPAPVPTTEPTPTPVPRLAPGITAEGVANASALAAAHDAVLQDASYTRRSNLTITYRNDTVRERRRVVTRVGAGHERLSSVASGTSVSAFVAGSPPVLLGAKRNEVYSNGTRALSAVTYANGTTAYYEIATGSVQESFADTDRAYLARALDRTETRVTGPISRNNTTLYRVLATEAALSAVHPPPKYGSIRKVRFRALVDSSGVLRERRMSYTATTGNGTTVSVTRSVEYRKVGATTVERPAWYGAAIESITNATNTTTAMDARDATDATVRLSSVHASFRTHRSTQ
jgi:hypothetical protein